MKKSLKSIFLISLITILTSCSSIGSSHSPEIEGNGSSDIATSTTENNNNSTSELNSENSSEEISDNSESQDKPNTPDIGSGEGLNEFGLANNIQDGTILHAWSWSLNSIKKALPDIAKAGYSAVQTSPMQPQKDFYNNDSVKSWWKVYQPLGFEIATQNNAIGTKNDLIDLCKEADKYGVKVIVDVVANHLAGGGRSSFHKDVQTYEPEIYNNKLCHDGKFDNSDSDPKLVVQGNIGGFPDLKTEDARVQNAVLDLLKEYVDCGVDGFRFDAAKHIETPEDKKEIASDFWNVVINGVNEYATSKGLHKPYHYGEILHTVGNDREYQWYTKRMSVTDSDASENTIKAVTSTNSMKINQKDIYKEGVDASSAVLWGESHDTFANDNGSTKHVSQKDVNKAYAINASRNEAASLYFPRPDGAMKLGGMTTTTDWKSNVITEVNKFHNHFIQSSEYIESDDRNYFANYKLKDGEYGALIVNLASKTNLALDTLGNLGEGTYIDKISNREYKVKDGILLGQLVDSKIAVLYAKGDVTPPVISDNPKVDILDDGITLSSEPISVKITAKNCDESYYQIDDGNKVKFVDEIMIKLGEENKDSKHTLKVFGKKGDKEVTKSETYTIIAPSEIGPKCINLPSELIQGRKIAAWVWESRKPKQSSRWVEGTLTGNTFVFPVYLNDTHFVLATFEKDAKLDWSNKIKQTQDIMIAGKIYDCNISIWK